MKIVFQLPIRSPILIKLRHHRGLMVWFERHKKHHEQFELEGHRVPKFIYDFFPHVTADINGNWED